MRERRHIQAGSARRAGLMAGQDPLQGTSAFNRHANPGALVFEQAGLLEAL